MSTVVASSSRALARRQPLLRQQLRRYADNATDAAKQTAEKAKETAGQAASKASEGLSKVQSSASSAASSAGSAASNVGGRIGRLVGAVESLIPPTLYYSRVSLELGKLVFQGQKMTPPSFQQFQSYFSPLISRLSNPSGAARSVAQSAQSGAASPESVLARLRSLDQASLARGGVLVAEVIGFFTVGEMLGRLKIVGYHGEAGHGDH